MADVKQFKIDGNTYNVKDETARNAIGNLPTFGSAASKDVPTSGNASASQVVMGNDSRLTDSRNAKDVSSWAKAASKPSYSASEISGLGTAATKAITDTYSSTGTDAISGKGVAAAIGALDVNSVGGDNKYIKAISETDGKISATAGNVDTTVTSGSSNLVTSGAVYTAIDNLPEPMIFKGSLGTGGTITSLPSASSSNKGYTYKVITAGTYASQVAKVGDLFISDGSSWVYIPSADEPSGTVTSVKIKASSPISVDSSDAITTSGERTISHANSGVTAGTYQSVTVNATGHVTSGGSLTKSNVTTALGYTPATKDNATTSAAGLMSATDKVKSDNVRRITRNNITSSLSNLSAAVSELNLEKYGYSIGDYFTGASGYTYFLADYNTFKGTNTPYCITTNHLGIVVCTHATSKWYTGDTLSVGYAGSTLHSYLSGTVLNNIKSDFTSLFGGWSGHLLSHSKMLSNAFENWAWTTDQYISALTCTQIDAGSHWIANVYQEGEASKSLELFRKYKWTDINNGEYIFLRDLYDKNTALCAGHFGHLGDLGVTTNGYVAGLILFK